MTRYDGDKIKALLKDHPEARSILAEYGIRCTECTKHDCFVSQIAENEELTMAQEVELMRRLDAVFEAGQPAAEKRGEPDVG